MTREEVERAIREGVRFLKGLQRDDGSWADVENDARTGVTSLVTLALLTAGEKPDSPTIRKALAYLRGFGPNDLHSTYAISLQTLVFAAAEPERDQLRIAANVALAGAVPRSSPAIRSIWPGSWTYSDSKRGRPGDNSNTQYALLGLHAASEAGVPVKPSVWELSRTYWERSQKHDGSWAYTPDSSNPTASMTCAGVSSLIISGLRRFQGQEFLQGEAIQNCGKGGVNRNLQAGIDWLANHFQVGQNFGAGQQWKFYYLYGLERAGRLAGIRFFGQHDWYRVGAEELVHEQNKLTGFWRGALVEGNEVLATSFALLFLAKGRAPVLINKLRHAPSGDWNNDPDDIRNIVSIVSRDWKTPPDLAGRRSQHRHGSGAAPGPDHLLQRPPRAGVFRDRQAEPARVRRARGFPVRRGLLRQSGVRPGLQAVDEGALPRRAVQAPAARRRTIRSGGPSTCCLPTSTRSGGSSTAAARWSSILRTDLSCYWNQSEHSPANTAVIKAIKVGQNVIDYATGREMPADKLTVREVHNFKADAPKRSALRIAKLKHAGDWNVAPQAIPNLMDALRKPPYQLRRRRSPRKTCSRATPT